MIDAITHSLGTRYQGTRCLVHYGIAIVFVLISHASWANEAVTLVQQFCVDCHGAPDESPEGGFSLAANFESSPLSETGPTLKKALDAIEGFEMPPTDGDQPSHDERLQLAAGIREWLARPTLGTHRDPGRPILRRLTRLEYNNTVRDLLGLETDVFMFSERLPFERSHTFSRSQARCQNE